MIKNWFFVFSIGLLGLFVSCGDKDVAFFSAQDEKALAVEIKSYVDQDSTIVLLSEEKFATSYTYARSVLNELIGEDSINTIFTLDLDWQIYLQEDIDVDASVTPGGHIYVTTGMISLLTNVDQFAGLLAHLMAHADQRHVTKQLFRYFSNEELIAAAGGNVEIIDRMIPFIFGNRVSYKFSSSDESKADEASVSYLAQTDYSCNATGRMFQVLTKQTLQGKTPAFYQTHAMDTTRSQTILAVAETLSCSTSLSQESGMTFSDFKNSLP